MSKNLHNSIQSVISDDKPNVRKSIVIGIGGSGMKGALSAKKWIETNIPDEAHRYMRWVGIDTTDIETSIEGKGGKYRFTTDQFFQEEKRMLYLSSPTPPVLSLDYLRDKFKNDECFDWLPNPDVYDISTRSGQGANQTRPLGRLAFFYNEKIIRDALIKERDRLAELSDDPKYFQLMDVKEGQNKKEEVLKFLPKHGVNKYYFSDKIPADHTIISIEPDSATRAILMPHISGKVEIENFPSDKKGFYFELSGSRFEGKTLSFKIRHVRRKGQISIFLTCSIVGGTGNGMIMDLAAMVKDIFKDFWPAPRIYGIMVLPSAFKRVVYNKNARANAYAALKEIDYFMSGNTFKAKYPSGRTVEIPDRLFEDGMLYLLDVVNLAGNSLQGRDQVQELTGQFISSFVASTVGGAIEERMVNDSTRSSIYLPKGEKSMRKAAYNSFGISRVIYPVPQLKELGYKITAVNMIKSFLKPVNPRLLLETIGDINRGLVRALRLNCRLIFERMYPDYAIDIEVELKSYHKKLERLIEKGEKRGVLSLMENVYRDYGKEEMEKIKSNLLSKMERRYSVELSKMKIVLIKEIHKYIKDAHKGFNFADTVIELLLDKLELYQKKYYAEKVALARYSAEEMEKLIEKMDKSTTVTKDIPEAMLEMVGFNFAQLVYEAMLASSENFVREFKAILFSVKNDEIDLFKDKVITLKEKILQEIENSKFDLLEKKNPLFFYLINDKEIKAFLKKYFYSRLSIEDLCNDVDFVKMDREDDVYQFIETYLISTEGLKIIEMSNSEIKEMIDRRFPNLTEKSIDDIKKELWGIDEKGEANEDFNAGLTLSDSTFLKIDIEKIKKKIFQIIYSRFEGLDFENISIKTMLDEKHIPVRKLLEKLDNFSRPYIYADTTGIQGMEYYRTITNFKLNTYEDGDDPNSGDGNDLPSRLDHYRKREEAVPNISVETFEVPNLCKPYEMISIGILLGFPIFKVNSLEQSAKDYHFLVAEKTHPLHCFNNPKFDAKYFPDPFRITNYLNPARLFSGMVMFKLLVKTEMGFQYEKDFVNILKEIEARENYKRVVLNIDKKIIGAGGLDNITLPLLVEAINTLGILAKNSVKNTFQFRREYSLIIRDILDGDGTSDRAKTQNLTKDKYIEKFIKNPQFGNMDDLEMFLENEINCREFLIGSIKDAIEKTKSNITAGADIKLPTRKINEIKLPVFKDKYDFYDYFEARGSLEWQNVLKERMVQKINSYVKSSKFRLESDPTLLDRRKISIFMDSLNQKVPEIVAWEVKVENKIIK